MTSAAAAAATPCSQWCTASCTSLCRWGAPAVVAAVVCRESSNAQLSMTARAHHNPKLSLPLITHPCPARTQICGAIFGSLLAAALVPGASINMGPDGPGCFNHGVHPMITRAQHFGWVRPRNALIPLACLAAAVLLHKTNVSLRWYSRVVAVPTHVISQEVVMTFTLISVVYACGVAKPGHGSFTPLAVGLTLVACAGTGGQYTGAALNPARVIGEVLRLT